MADDYRWPRLAQDLLALLDVWFPGERVHGVGPSMGCATLLHAALLDPGRFSGLTLMVPPTAWETRAAKAHDYERSAEAVEAHGLELLLRAQAAAPAPPATAGAPDTVPDVRTDLLPWVFRGAARSDLPDRESLRSIDLPTTILAWTDDPAHPLSTAGALLDLLPRATLQVASTRAEVDRWPAVLMADVERTVR